MDKNSHCQSYAIFGNCKDGKCPGPRRHKIKIIHLIETNPNAAEQLCNGYIARLTAQRDTDPQPGPINLGIAMCYKHLANISVKNSQQKKVNSNAKKALLEQANRYFRQAYNLCKNCAPVLCDYGLFLLKNKDPNGEFFLLKSIENNPTGYRYFKVAQYYASIRDFETAIKYYKLALEKNPKRGHYWSDYAGAWYQLMENNPFNINFIANCITVCEKALTFLHQSMPGDRYYVRDQKIRLNVCVWLNAATVHRKETESIRESSVSFGCSIGDDEKQVIKFDDMIGWKKNKFNSYNTHNNTNFLFNEHLSDEKNDVNYQNKKIKSNDDSNDKHFVYNSSNHNICMRIDFETGQRNICNVFNKYGSFNDDSINNDGRNNTKMMKIVNHKHNKPRWRLRTTNKNNGIIISNHTCTNCNDDQNNKNMVCDCENCSFTNRSPTWDLQVKLQESQLQLDQKNKKIDELQRENEKLKYRAGTASACVTAPAPRVPPY